MKVGILTFHFVENYGGVLQAYALQTFLKKQGYDVDVVNYQPEFIAAKYRILDDYYLEVLKERKHVLFLKLSFVKIASFPFLILKKNRFKRFLKKAIRLSGRIVKTYEECEKIISRYDVLVCGSDQIWNCDITNGFDPVYFADFPVSVRKVSYAASIGKDNVDESEKAKLREYASKMSKISVREDSLKQILDSMRINVHVLCDPVFLLQPNEWRKLYLDLKKTPPHRGYVLIYLLERNGELESFAESLAKKEGLELIEVCLNYKLKSGHEKNLYCESPESFIWLIDHADYIVTNSFHACAFSIIFHKNFFVRPHSTRGSRICDLLKRYGLLCCTELKPIRRSKIDWKAIDNAICEETKRSEGFIWTIM